MSQPTIDGLKQIVLDAGLEIYRTNGGEIQIAERVRMHLMDSGVSVGVDDGARVYLTVRSQRSDFPSLPTEEMFHKVRDALERSATERGFHEVKAIARDITDPVDPNHVLDVWHELTFAKAVKQPEALIEAVRWALLVPKCVNR